MLIRLKAIHQKSKKRYKQSLFIIPYLFTYLNAVFGFLSILKVYEGDYITAAYYIILAAFMDGFDGRLARALGSSSYFGMELDSLADAVSFCLAPTLLMYTWLPDNTFGAKAVLAFYLCAGLARLAKFNISNDRQQTEFIGLPTTIAAFFIATCVLYDKWVNAHYWKVIFSVPLVYVLICFIALLMISSVRFCSFKRYKINLPRDYAKIVLFALLFSYAVACGYPWLLLLVTGYILFGVLKTLFLSMVYIYRSFVN